MYVHIVPKEIRQHNHDKYYVGITSRGVNKRWQQYGTGYRDNKHFWRAIIKYGWENIQHEIVAQNLTRNEAIDMEKALILSLQSYINTYGYNKTMGGDGTVGHKMSDSEKEKRSIAYSGKNNPYYGKRHTKETRILMSNKHYDCLGGNNPRAKTIYQFDLNWNYINHYPSSRDAARALNCTDGMGSAAINHKKSLGYLWVFEDNIIIDDFGHIQVKNKFTPINKTNNKVVYQFDKNKNYITLYESVALASKKTGLHKQNIGSVARHIKNTTGGYIWRYKEDVIEKDGSFFIV